MQLTDEWANRQTERYSLQNNIVQILTAQHYSVYVSYKDIFHKLAGQVRRDSAGTMLFNDQRFSSDARFRSVLDCKNETMQNDMFSKQE